jgi:vancomycin resistance protein YoaR
VEEKKKPSVEGEKNHDQTEEAPLVTGETTTWNFSEEIQEKINQPEIDQLEDKPQDQQLALFQPPEVLSEENEKQNAFLLWLGQKKILVTALVCLLLIVGGTFITVSYYWITESMADKEQNPIVPIIPQEKPAHLILQLEGLTYDLDLKKVGYNGNDLKTINDIELREWLDSVKRKVDIPVTNAKGQRFGEPIQPEKPGRYMDTNEVNKWLLQLGPILNKAQTIPVITVNPTVTQEDLEHVNDKLIGSYTTTFDAGNINRTTNIRLSSEAIDNIILTPGQIFSFNKVVGERTSGKGYQVAHVIVKGEFSEGIGGGICQVSSTLYNSVDEAGLKIVRRFSHSALVTYVPPGRDATVSWGGPDFRFKNNFDKPILVRINIQGGKIAIKTYTVSGSKVDKSEIEAAPKTFSEMKVTDNVQVNNNETPDMLPSDKN